MSEPKRRRGAQPGNHNAQKHGLYRGKPAPGQRPRGAPPCNLNRLLHGQNSVLLRPPAVQPKPAHPLTVQLSLERATLTLFLASYDATLSQIEKQCLDLLDDPHCPPAELVLRLRQLNTRIYQLLCSLPVVTPTGLCLSERTKPQ